MLIEGPVNYYLLLLVLRTTQGCGIEEVYCSTEEGDSQWGRGYIRRRRYNIFTISKLAAYSIDILHYYYKPNHVHTRTCCVVDKVLNDIRRDLKESGLYFKYMQEKGPDE